MKLVTFKDGRAIPGTIKPLASELQRMDVGKGRVRVTFSPLTQPFLSRLRRATLTSGLNVLYDNPDGLAIPAIFDLKKSALRQDDLLDVLTDFFGIRAVAEAVVKLASGGPELLQIDPRRWFGPHGASCNCQRFMRDLVKRSYPMELNAADLTAFREHFARYLRKIEEAQCSETVRAERRAWLESSRLAFNQLNKTHI